MRVRFLQKIAVATDCRSLNPEPILLAYPENLYAVVYYDVVTYPKIMPKLFGPLY